MKPDTLAKLMALGERWHAQWLRSLKRKRHIWYTITTPPGWWYLMSLGVWALDGSPEEAAYRGSLTTGRRCMTKRGARRTHRRCPDGSVLRRHVLKRGREVVSLLEVA